MAVKGAPSRDILKLRLLQLSSGWFEIYYDV